MKSEERQAKKATEQIAKTVGKDKTQGYDAVVQKVMKKGMVPKDFLGLSDQMVEGIYGQAYRLYNSGNYKDAIQIFRLLIMINSMEAKYSLGLAACFHMMKDYKSAAEMYTLCGILDTQSPIPPYHASDCYLQMNDKVSALISLEMAVKKAGARPEYQTLKDRAVLTAENLKKELQKPKE